MPSEGTSVLETSSAKQKYRLKLNRVYISLMIAKRTRPSSAAIIFGRLGLGNTNSSNTALRYPI
jgi:hypothetical protein